MDSSRLASHRRVPIVRGPQQCHVDSSHILNILSLLCTLRLPVSYSGYLTADASLRLTRDSALTDDARATCPSLVVVAAGALRASGAGPAAEPPPVADATFASRLGSIRDFRSTEPKGDVLPAKPHEDLPEYPVRTD